MYFMLIKSWKDRGPGRISSEYFTTLGIIQLVKINVLRRATPQDKLWLTSSYIHEG